MFCFIGFIFIITMASLQACPDPMTVHIHHLDGAIILHSENCDQQPRYHSNQYAPHTCDTDCRCVSKQSYSPYPVTSYTAPTCYCCCPVYSCSSQYPATNAGSGCYPVQDAKPVSCGGSDRGYSTCQ